MKIWMLIRQRRQKKGTDQRKQHPAARQSSQRSKKKNNELKAFSRSTWALADTVERLGSKLQGEKSFWPHVWLAESWERWHKPTQWHPSQWSRKLQDDAWDWTLLRGSVREWRWRTENMNNAQYATRCPKTGDPRVSEKKPALVYIWTTQFSFR